MAATSGKRLPVTPRGEAPSAIFCRMRARRLRSSRPWRPSRDPATFRPRPSGPVSGPAAPSTMTTHDPLPSHVFYRKLTRRYPRIVRGEGCWLYDDDGRRLPRRRPAAPSSPTWATACGRSPPRSAARPERLAYVNGTAFTSDPVEELAAEIARRSPGDLDLVYPLASGSEAVEAALKLARQYWVESGQPGTAQDPGARPGLSRQHPARALGLGPRALQDLLPGLAGRVRPGAGAVRLPLRLPRRAAALSELQRRGGRGGARCAKGPTRSRPCSPSRSAAPPPARRCRRRSTGGGSARPATGTASC